MKVTYCLQEKEEEEEQTNILLSVITDKQIIYNKERDQFHVIRRRIKVSTENGTQQQPVIMDIDNTGKNEGEDDEWHNSDASQTSIPPEGMAMVVKDQP